MKRFVKRFLKRFCFCHAWFFQGVLEEALLKRFYGTCEKRF